MQGEDSSDVLDFDRPTEALSLDRAECVLRTSQGSVYVQLRAFSRRVCKTVGSAYAGSSPAPATSQTGSSEALRGLFCVSGTCSRRQSEAAACHHSTNIRAMILAAFSQVGPGFRPGSRTGTGP